MCLSLSCDVDRTLENSSSSAAALFVFSSSSSFCSSPAVTSWVVRVSLDETASVDREASSLRCWVSSVDVTAESVLLVSFESTGGCAWILPLSVLRWDCCEDEDERGVDWGMSENDGGHTNRVPAELNGNGGASGMTMPPSMVVE